MSLLFVSCAYVFIGLLSPWLSPIKVFFSVIIEQRRWITQGKDVGYFSLTEFYQGIIFTDLQMTQSRKQHIKQTLSTYTHVACNIYGIYLLCQVASNLLTDSANDYQNPHMHTYFTLGQGMGVYIAYD